MILWEGGAVALPGLAAGAAVSLAFARWMQSVLYRLSPMDPVSLAAVGLLLCGITLFSVWLPARRASRVDAGVALRAE